MCHVRVHKVAKLSVTRHSSDFFLGCLAVIRGYIRFSNDGGPGE